MTDLAPSESKVQQEAYEYDQPTSESSIQAIGALANALREIISPVGTILPSMLDEATFQAQNTVSTRWILADGRMVVGSQYEALTGNSSVPDLRGIYLRGKNNGRSGSTGNPYGDLTLGTYAADVFFDHNHGGATGGQSADHTHQIWGYAYSAAYGGDNQGANIPVDTSPIANTHGTSNDHTHTIASAGGSETAPRTVTINWFIRIN